MPFVICTHSTVQNNTQTQMTISPRERGQEGERERESSEVRSKTLSSTKVIMECSELAVNPNTYSAYQ